MKLLKPGPIIEIGNLNIGFWKIKKLPIHQKLKTKPVLDGEIFKSKLLLILPEL